MASSARIEELKKKFDENPRRYFAPLANEFRKTGDFDQAILICQEFLPQQPGHMSGHIVFGQALFEAGRLEEARAVFETALTLDPENLIALRHLGDISRAGGDIEAARAWYRRVLDADPRNEEIASVLASLDEPATVAWTSPTPKSVPMLSGEAEHRGSAAEFGTASPERTSEGSLEGAAREKPVVDFNAMMIAASEAQARPAPKAESSAGSSDTELIELEDTELTFGDSQPRPVDGLEVERSVATPAGFESIVSQSPTADLSSLPALEGLESTSFTPPASVTSPDAESSAKPEARVPADEARSAAEPLVSFENFELAAPGERAEPPAAQSAEAEIPAATEAGAPAREPDEGSGESGRASSPGFVTETMAELYVQQGHVEEAIVVYQQLVERYPGDEVLRARLAELASTRDQAPTEETSAAEHAEAPPMPDDVAEPAAGTEAHALPPAATQEERPVAEAPDLEAVAARGAPDDAQPSDASWQPAMSTAPSGSEAPVLAADTPTIREFLSAIASWQPAAGATSEMPERASSAPASDNGAVFEESAAESRADDILFSEIEALGGPARPEPAEAEAASDVTESVDAGAGASSEPPRDESSVGGSIDALFTGAETSRADEEAASTLADAFAQEADEEEQQMAGNPARRAQDELSLDHVFRDRPPGAERGQPSFSFDQFFSQNAAEHPGAAPAGQTGTPSASPDDDIQQFNAWLEGLKKT